MNRTASLFLALLMVFCGIRIPKASAESVTPSEPYEVAEIPEKRTENSDTYLLSDGSYQCVVYSEDKYYRDAEGSLALIDNSITACEAAFEGEPYAYSNTANSSRYYFSGSAPSVMIDNGGSRLCFSMVCDEGAAPVVGGNKDIPELAGYALCGDNFISYPGVSDGTEVIYSAKNGMLKEYLHGSKRF